MTTLAFALLNAVQAVFLGVWSAFWIAAAGVVSLFSSELPLVMARRCWAPGLIWAAGAKMRVDPLPATLEPDGTYVFVMNHQSMFDIPAAFRYLPYNLRFVLKKVLLYVPFLGFYTWRTKMIFVDRSNPDQAYESLMAAVDRIRDGTSIIAFPEGTRRVGPVRKLKRGPFVLAQAAGVSVVPVAIEGSGRLLPRGTFKLRPGEVRMAVGEPIRVGGESHDPRAVDRLRREVTEALVALHESIGGQSTASLKEAA